jgi:imidazole glycerol-phosphate synthase subunit HisH
MPVSIGILDVGAANRRSIAIALERCGAAPFFIASADAVRAADALVLPGVANFGFVAETLDRSSLRAPIAAAICAGVPALGICAGFQLFFDASDEAPGARGLGVFRGTVRALRGPRSPHMGWNTVQALHADEIVKNGWAYFAHAFAPPADTPEAVARTQYGEMFVSAASRGSVTGVQFHPERSGAYGHELLGRFVAIARSVHAR